MLKLTKTKEKLKNTKNNKMTKNNKITKTKIEMKV